MLQNQLSLFVASALECFVRTTAIYGRKGAMRHHCITLNLLDFEYKRIKCNEIIYDVFLSNSGNIRRGWASVLKTCL